MKTAWQSNNAIFAKNEELDLFREMADKSNVGIAITDLSGKLLYSNNSLLKMHGFVQDDIQDKHFSVFLGDDQILKAQQILRKIKEEGYIFLEEVISRNKEGHDMPVLLNANVVCDKGGEPAYLTATVVDVTEKVAAENALKSNEALYRALFDTAPMGLAVTNLNGDILLANKHLMEKTKATESDIYNSNMKDIYTDPADREKLLKILLKNGKVNNFETSVRDASGAKILINVNASVFSEMQDTLMVAIKDITEKKRDEEKLNCLVNQLSETNNDMQLFTKKVSKDLRDPLKYIESYCQIFIDLYGSSVDEKGRGFLNKILSSCDRMRHSIEDVLNLSLSINENLEKEKINLSEIFEYQSNSLALTIKNLRAEFNIDPDIYVVADKNLMKIFAENLLKGLLSLLPENHIVVFTFFQNQVDKFCLEISSPLFSPGESEQLFSSASGLADNHSGFALARRIIQRHKGWIKAEDSSASNTSRIIFALPD